MKVFNLRPGQTIKISERETEKVCPLCKQPSPVGWFVPSEIPVFFSDGRVDKIPSVLAECCAQLYVEAE